MSCQKHGYTNNVFCPECDLETIEVNSVTADTPERFRVVEPLQDAHGIVAQVCNERYDDSSEYFGDNFGYRSVSIDIRCMSVPEARALRDWLNKALPEEKP